MYTVEANEQVLSLLLVTDRDDDLVLLNQLVADSSIQAKITVSAFDVQPAFADLIFLDFPEGSEWLSKWRKINAHVPVIALCDHYEDASYQQAQQAGVDDFLDRQSISSLMLHKTISYVLAKLESQQQLLEREHYDLLTGVPNRAGFRDK